MATQQASLPPCSGLLRPTSLPKVCFCWPKRQLADRSGRPQHYRFSRGPALAPTQQSSATRLIGGAFGGGNEIFVAGADGQLGARIVQRLLQAGFKVVAGVPDREQAQSAVDFASSVELLRKQEVQKLQLTEVDLSDASSIAGALPRRGARVLAVIGDSSGRSASRLDARAASRVIQAAQEANASQFILVAPSGSSGGSGGNFLGGLFGGGSKGGLGNRLSKIEQEIVEAGLDFIIVRAGRTDVQDPDFESSTNTAVGAQGSLPSASRITKNQVALVVQQVVRLGNPDLLIETWASKEAPESSIEDAVQEVLPLAAFGEDDLEGEEEEIEEEPADEEEDDVEVPKTPGGLFGGFGTRRIKAGGDAPPALQPSSSAGGKGTGPPPPKKAPFRRGRKGGAADSSTEKDESTSGKRPGSIGGFLGRAKKEADQAEISPERARRSAAKGARKAGEQAQKAAQLPPGADQKAPPKKGLLAALGFGGETKYVEDGD